MDSGEGVHGEEKGSAFVSAQEEHKDFDSQKEMCKLERCPLTQKPEDLTSILQNPYGAGMGTDEQTKTE